MSSRVTKFFYTHRDRNKQLFYFELTESSIQMLELNGA